MAELNTIEEFVDQMAVTLARKFSPEERTDAVAMYYRHLGQIPDVDLITALDIWINRATADKPHYGIAPSSEIRGIVRDLEQKQRTHRPPSAPIPRPHVRPDFRAAHLAAYKQLGKLWELTLEEHRHTPKQVTIDAWDEFGNQLSEWKDGEEVCPVCGPAGDPLRARIQDILIDLPEPEPKLSTCPGCDGSGWNPSESIPGYKSVEPCRSCNPVYEAWLQGEL